MQAVVLLRCRCFWSIFVVVIDEHIAKVARATSACEPIVAILKTLLITSDAAQISHTVLLSVLLTTSEIIAACGRDGKPALQTHVPLPMLPGVAKHALAHHALAKLITTAFLLKSWIVP